MKVSMAMMGSKIQQRADEKLKSKPPESLTSGGTTLPGGVPSDDASSKPPALKRMKKAAGS